ncbi:MAG: hypothetical protein ACREKH_03040 [Candidatus Rokuibacteriota bacterium]
MLATVGAAPAWAGKTTICHFPPGNPANFHTITVGDNAVSAHVNNHGDLIGSCLENCETICDDGNACTIDVEPDPEQCICTAEPRPQVDCNDGNQCTADACDPVNGTCTNDPGPLDGSACDDGDPGTTGEVCVNGSCVSCPCFTSADLVANGPILECGSNFPGFPDLTGMIWVDGRRACSGRLCGSGNPADLTCIIQKPELILEFLTPQEDQGCRAILLNNCPNPNLTNSPLSGGESETPFIDG